MDTWEWALFLRRHWRIIGITTIAVVLVTMGVTLAMAPAYQSTATLWVQPLTPENPFGLPQTLQLGATNAGELIKSPNVAARTTRILGKSPEDLGVSLQYRVIESSSLLQITAEASTPRRAAEVANAAGKAYMEEASASMKASSKTVQTQIEQKLADLRAQIAGLQKKLAAARNRQRGEAEVAALQDHITTLQTSYEQLLQAWQNVPVNETTFASWVQLVDLARPQDSPVRPRPALNLLLSLVGGFFAGLGVARAVETARPRAERSETPTTVPGDGDSI